MKIIKILCCSLLLLSLPLQAKTTVTPLNNWFLLVTDIQLSPHWTFANELQERTFTTLANQYFLEEEAAFFYKPNKNFNIGFGAAIIDLTPPDPIERQLRQINALGSAQRLFVEANLLFKFAGMDVLHRPRQEVGFDHGINVDQRAERAQIYRFRYRLDIKRHFYTFNQKDRTLFLRFYDEVFYIENNIPTNTLFENQNIVYFGLGYQIDRSNSLQIGYANQRIRQSANHYTELPAIKMVLYHGFE